MAKIGKNIFDQIKKLDRHALLAWGAKDIVFLKNGLQFKTSGDVKFKGYVRITLNSHDLYDIEFYKLRGVNQTTVKTMKNVPVENLVESIDSVVG